MKPPNSTAKPAQRARQCGAVALEFALVSVVFFLLLIGITEWGRILFFWNTTAEATRLGARMAVVCDLNDSDIRARMRALFPVLTDADIKLQYDPPACTVDDCKSVTVSINPGKEIPIFIPVFYDLFIDRTLLLPEFTTTLSRESLQSTFNGTTNPVCQPP